jgi:hypothetical protein
MKSSRTRTVARIILGIVILSTTAARADWLEDLLWAASLRDGPFHLDCPQDYPALVPDCMAVGRACVIDRARNAAEHGDGNRAMDLVKLTQCQNRDARIRLDNHRDEVLQWLGYHPSGSHSGTLAWWKTDHSCCIAEHRTKGSLYYVFAKNGTENNYICDLDFTLKYRDADDNEKYVTRHIQINLFPHFNGDAVHWDTAWAASTLSEVSFAQNCRVVKFSDGGPIR